MVLHQKAQISTPEGDMFNAVYLGRSMRSTKPLERFSCPDGINLPLNASLGVKSGRKRIGEFLLATIRPDENTILLIKKENLSCPD